MKQVARHLYPAELSYQGEITRPARWADWEPHEGDIIVSTPAKCGTTWTQTMITMLLYGTTDLPDRMTTLSPWLDSFFEDADRAGDVPLNPSGRRVVKTHTPADGFPVWQDVHVVAVYRHPLDVFLSIRKHVMNAVAFDNPDLCGPLDGAFAYYLNGVIDRDDIDRDFLVTVANHYLHTVHRPHLVNLTLLHYSDMIADHRGTVARLAHALEITQDDALIDAVTEATRFGEMRANAAHFAPEGGKGFWHKDAAFFDMGGTHKWQGKLTEEQIAAFDAQLAVMVPDVALRDWLKYGSSTGAGR